ncbi:hypothetical protein CGZ60_05320 [Neisseria animalis]|nr:hypothetical protein CGZ60_05320 [Neisseria animalis]
MQGRVLHPPEVNQYLESYHFKNPKRAGVKTATASPCHEFCKGSGLKTLQNCLGFAIPPRCSGSLKS